MARTQAVYYCDANGAEPVNDFIESLPDKRAAKIDDFVEQYLNGQPSEAAPPEHPVSSQIEGQLHELRVRFATTRYRVLYQRSENLIVLLHAFEKNTGAVPNFDKQLAQARMADFVGRMNARPRRSPRAAGTDAPASGRLIEKDKLERVMTTTTKKRTSPKGVSANSAADRRAKRSESYGEARDEYAEIRGLRKKNWIAAHIRERRYELELTQREVAKRAGTAHSYRTSPSSSAETTCRRFRCCSASSRCSTKTSS